MQSDRLEEIINIIAKHKAITINDISSLLGCSNATVRRDIAILEDQQQIKRVGSCIMTPQSNMIASRMDTNTYAKGLIGKMGATQIADNDVVYMDSSTTVAEMAYYIPQNMSFTVVTNSLMIATRLENYYRINIIVLGGTLRHGTSRLSGSITVNTLHDMTFRKAFFGAAAISNDGDVMFYDIEDIDLRKNILSRSNEIFVLADHSKFFAPGLQTVIKASTHYTLITDELPENYLNFAQSTGIKILMANQ